MHCIICEGRKIKKCFVKNNYDYFQCKRCGLIFVTVQPSQEEIKEFYTSSYYDAWRNELHQTIDTRLSKHKTFNHWLNKIERYVQQKSLLDIGCAFGFFLEVCSERGWQVYGVEVSEYASRIAKGKFGSRIINGFLSNGGFKPESFEVITMFDLLEHQADPLGFLKEVKRLLKPRGFIALSTADTQSLGCKLTGKYWTHFKAPEHLYYFSRTNLVALLKRCGFDTIELCPAHKYLNLSFIKSYFEIYKMPFITQLSLFLFKILPRRLSSLPVRLPTGEMFVLAQKESRQ